MARTSASSRTITDHDEIRNWAEERGAKPTCVKGTGGGQDTGMIRLDFPGYSGANSLQPISWNDWFEKFDDNNLTLLVQDQTARGERSNFSKIVSRETASPGRRSSGRGTQSRSARSKNAAGTGRTQRSTSRSSSSSGANSSARSASEERSNTSARGRSTDRSGTGRQGRSSRTEAARRSASSTGSQARTSARKSASRASRGSRGSRAA